MQRAARTRVLGSPYIAISDRRIGVDDGIAPRVEGDRPREQPRAHADARAVSAVDPQGRRGRLRFTRPIRAWR
jgi:hypothetical protein